MEDKDMLGWFFLTLVASFAGCLAALVVYDKSGEWEWPELPRIHWDRLFPPEFVLGLAAIVLIVTAFVAFMRTAESVAWENWILAAVKSVLAVALGIASIAMFALAARRWWKYYRRAWAPVVLAIVWTTTAGYLLYVGAMAGWSGDWVLGVFYALGAAASAAFALPLIVAAMYAKRHQQKMARAKNEEE